MLRKNIPIAHLAHPKRLASLASLILAALAPGAVLGADLPPDPGAVMFSERCSTCHNIGGGAKVGPDLFGVVTRRSKTWFARFVRGPAQMIDGGDPIAAGLYAKFAPVKMPDQPLTDQEVDAVWAYFTSCTDKGGCQPVALGPRWGIDGNPEEIARGRDIFLGDRRLQRGGAPCFSCHNARGEGWLGGGTLGPDLTFAYARLGEKGMGPLLGEMSSPVMRSVYGAAKLEDDEQFAVKAYLADLARTGSFPRKDRDFFALGVEGTLLILGAFVLRKGARAVRRSEGKSS